MTVRRALGVLTGVLLGLGLGAVVHYLLYRIGLPLKPFIYVAF